MRQVSSAEALSRRMIWVKRILPLAIAAVLSACGPNPALIVSLTRDNIEQQVKAASDFTVEMAKSGQCFYIPNTIKTLEAIRSRIQSPDVYDVRLSKAEKRVALKFVDQHLARVKTINCGPPDAGQLTREQRLRVAQRNTPRPGNAGGSSDVQLREGQSQIFHQRGNYPFGLFQPRIEVGIAGGFGKFNTGTTQVNGNDNFGGIDRPDPNGIDLSQATGVVGPTLTIFTPSFELFSGAAGNRIRGFLKVGALFPVGGDSTGVVTDINAVPRVTAEVRHSPGVIVPVLAGFSIPIARGTEFLVGGGVAYHNDKFDVLLRDVGAGPGAPTYGGTFSASGVDPAITGGVRFQLPPGIELPGVFANAPISISLDTTVVFPRSRNVSFNSPNFASEAITIVTPGDPQVTVMAGVNIPIDPAWWQRGPDFIGGQGNLAVSGAKPYDW